MRLPMLPDGAPRLVIILGIPLIAFALTLGLTIGMEAEDDEDTETATSRATEVPPTVTIAVALATPQAQPTAAPAPTPAPVVARTDCTTIRGTDYRSDEERDWFQANCIEAAPAFAITAPVAQSVSASASTSVLTGSSDRLVIARLAINAPVNYRLVTEGELGNPIGAFDVVWYDFSLYLGYLGGYPGGGGNAVFAGHVDYRGVGPAVFYQLRNIQEGDVIDYHRSDGINLRYVVQWYGDVDPEFDFTQYVTYGAGDVITLITCNGDFDFVNRVYSHRRIVRAVLVE